VGRGEFAKAGLAPAARDDKGAQSLQSVPLVEYRPNAAANFLALSSGGRRSAGRRRRSWAAIATMWT
jgi:hypothetical protein